MRKHFDSKFLIFGAAGVFAVFALYLIFQGRGDRMVFNGDSAVLQAESPVSENMTRRFSDGMPIGDEEQVKRFLGVMVENSADAWPLSGIAKARLVIEAPVEGFIPRLFVLFDDTQEVEKIGPVRSARPYYVEWAYGMKSLYAHVGGSPQGLALLQSLPIKSLNQFYFGQFFWRSTDRYAPHNVYTSIQKLAEGYEYRSYDDEELNPLFSYKEDAPSGVDEQNFSVSILPGASQYRAGWSYDSKTNSYIRYQGGSKQLDSDQSEVAVKNVIVIYTDISVIDDLGRLQLRTLGEGTGAAFIDGEEKQIRWKKEANDLWLDFTEDDSGEALRLNAGMTWIEVVSAGTEINSNL